MALALSILYRGPLVSCNYACPYCPFAKRTETPAEQAADRAAVERFVGWVESRPADDRLGILITPWGEALTRRWYRDALVRLSRLPQVTRAAVQTNLSCGLGWVDDADKRKLAFWTTFHPGEVERERFVARCRELHEHGVRFSVGVVGLRDHFPHIDRLREELPAGVYLWVNAYKDVADYYQAGEAEWLAEVDPFFPVNNVRHASLGRPCGAGETAISVSGDGTIRRCHFVKEVIGNLYEAGSLEAALRPRLCPNATCGCHIGYIHMPELGMTEAFGEGLLERVPLALVQSVAGRLSP